MCTWRSTLQVSYVVPVIYERAADAAALQSQHRLVTKRREDWRRARIRRLLGSVRPAEFDAVGHEQDGGRVLPDRLEPGSFSRSS